MNVEMDDDDGGADFEILDPALRAAVQAVLAEPLPEEAIERVRARAKTLAVRRVAPLVSLAVERKRPPRARRWVTSIAAVAAALALMLSAASWFDRSAGRALAQTLERVKAASTVRFRVTTQFGRQPENHGRMYLAGNQMRYELLDGALIHVGRIDEKQGLVLDMQRKLAQRLDVDDDAARAFADPIEQLRRAKSDDAESIGEELLDGRRTQVYRLRKVNLLGMRGAGEMLVWVDQESELPEKIVVRDPDPKARTEVRFDEFVWNAPLDDELFSMSVPEGFTTGTIVTRPTVLAEDPPSSGSLDAPNIAADGVLSRDRVPARIIWDAQRATITALMRDPESTPSGGRRANELRQWDVAAGALRWSTAVAGAPCMAITEDGKLLAAVIGDEVQIRDATTGKVARTWVTDQTLYALAFAPDGKTLAAGISEWGPHGGKGGEMSGGVQFWDVERGSLIRSVDDARPNEFVKFSPDGRYAAASSTQGPVKLWEAATGELTRIFPGRSPADFSPDGQTLACVAADASADADDEPTLSVHLYNLEDGSLVRSFAVVPRATASWLLCVTFSPDGSLLAAADWNGSVTLWDVATGRVAETITDHQAGVHVAAFSPNGAQLATGSEDKTLRLWTVPLANP